MILYGRDSNTGTEQSVTRFCFVAGGCSSATSKRDITTIAKVLSV